jgi:hypothetical protein
LSEVQFEPVFIALVRSFVSSLVISLVS